MNSRIRSRSSSSSSSSSSSNSSWVGGGSERDVYDDT